MIVYKILNTIDSMNRWIGKIISFLLIFITFFTVYEVISRYFFKSPTIWVWDLNLQLFACLILLTGGYTMAEKAHISIDVLIIHLSRRKRALINIFTSLFFFLFIGIVIWYGWEIAIESFQRREVLSTIWAPPMYTIRIFVPVGAMLLLLQGISALIRDMMFLFGKTEDYK